MQIIGIANKRRYPLVELFHSNRKSSQAAQSSAIKVFSRLQVYDHGVKSRILNHAITVSVQRRALTDAYIAVKTKHMRTLKVSSANTALQQLSP